ncbi:MAG: histidinol-phosphate transaminase, partial [Oscillospiraceae bacterium]
MSKYLDSKLSNLQAYTPGEQPREQILIKLNTNECPFPPSPKLKAAVAAEMDRLNLYPDPTGKALVDAFAQTR